MKIWRFYLSLIFLLVGDSDSNSDSGDSGSGSSDSGDSSNGSDVSVSLSDNDSSESSDRSHRRLRHTGLTGRQRTPGELSADDLQDIPPPDSKPFEWPS